MNAPRSVVELVGVYHANGTLRGELAYVVGKVFGRAHCALCDITHGTLRRKPEFDRCASQLPVPLTLVHLDERSSAVAEATEGATPCVAARYGDDSVEVLLTADDLERCSGDPARLVAEIERRL